MQFKKAENAEKCLNAKLMMWGFSKPLTCERYKPDDNVIEKLNKKTGPAPPQGGGAMEAKESSGPSGPRPPVQEAVPASQFATSAQMPKTDTNQVGIFFLKKDISQLHNFFTQRKENALLPHERYTFVQLTSVTENQLSNYPIGKKVMIQVVGLYADKQQQSAIVEIKDTEIAALAQTNYPTVTLACSDQRVVPQNIAKENSTLVQEQDLPSFQGTLGYLNAENRVVTQTSGPSSSS